MHSYMAHNGMLATVYFRLQAEKAQLAAYLDQLPGGQQSALDSAKIRQGELEAKVRAENTTPTDTPVISGINTPVDPGFYLGLVCQGRNARAASCCTRDSETEWREKEKVDPCGGC
jgi:hypothetical protein